MSASKTRTLTREQSRLVDRLAVEEFGFSGLVLMENAGRGVADVLCRLGIGGPVAVCCGRGNNAGDGFVIARHLDLRGHAVRVLLWARPEELAGDAAANFRILTKTDVPIEVFGETLDEARLSQGLAGAVWIVDALLGTGSRGEPRPPLDAVIDRLNAARAEARGGPAQRDGLRDRQTGRPYRPRRGDLHVRRRQDGLSCPRGGPLSRPPARARHRRAAEADRAGRRVKSGEWGVERGEGSPQRRREAEETADVGYASA